jgi:hypothetical protein
VIGAWGIREAAWASADDNSEGGRAQQANLLEYS